MKKSGAFIIFITFCVSVKAQYVGLNSSEIQNLHTLAAKDSGVVKQYDASLRLADGAVSTPPSPINFIRTEGLLKGNPNKTATDNALKDMQKMYALALGYREKNDNVYLICLSAYLQSWAITNKSLGDPIDDTNIEPVIEAYDMVKTDLTPQVNSAVVAWLKQTADAEISTFQIRTNKISVYNNWNSHRLKIIGLIAYAINDSGYKKYINKGLKIQLQKNLLPDGSSIDFQIRDALHYHVYDLEPLLRLAIVIKRATGVNEYKAVSSTGSSIKKSVEWMIPYIRGEKTHKEFVNSKVPFDLARAKNMEAGYKPGTLWKPLAGIKTLALAAYFDPQYNELVKSFNANTNSSVQWQLTLNELDK